MPLRGLRNGEGAKARALLLGLISTHVCALPVHQFLSIGADLEKSRVGDRARAARVPGTVDVPNVVDGVYFLHTGYPECLEFQ